MSQSNYYWQQKLERDAPEKLGEFIAYLTSLNGSLYLLGVGGESAYHWALKS